MPKLALLLRERQLPPRVPGRGGRGVEPPRDGVLPRIERPRPGRARRRVRAAAPGAAAAVGALARPGRVRGAPRWSRRRERAPGAPRDRPSRHRDGPVRDPAPSGSLGQLPGDADPLGQLGPSGARGEDARSRPPPGAPTVPERPGARLGDPPGRLSEPRTPPARSYRRVV